MASKSTAHRTLRLPPTPEHHGDERRPAHTGLGRLARGAAAGACIALTCMGCRLAGTWVTVDVEPADATFPIAEITFDQNGHCTADMATNGHRRTLVGTYRWRGTKLVIEPDDGDKQVYRARRLTRGRLRLKQTVDQEIRATLERRE